MESADEKPLPAPRRAAPRRLTRKHLALLAAAVAAIVLGYLAQPYLKLLGPAERCWEIQEVDGKLYKVNPCTGQFRLLGDAPPADGKR